MQVIYEGMGLSRSRTIPWRSRLTLGWGKLRRFYLAMFRPRYVEQSLKRRTGECHRTGACCHLMFSCPMLRWRQRTPFCRIYLRRPSSCVHFPIDERDLRDRDILHPWEPCGFSFLRPEEASREVEESVRVELVAGR